MVVDVSSEGGLRPGRARPLIDPWPFQWTVAFRDYDVFADGSFVAISYGGEPGESLEQAMRRRYRVGEFKVVTNWLDELRERMGSN